MATSSAMQHLRYIVEEIGSRPIGTEAHHKAAEYIATTLKGNGFATHEQRFDCPLWTAECASIELDSLRFPAILNTFTPPCDVTAAICAIGSMSELEEANLEGKIAVLYGELIRIGFIAKSFKIYNPEINQRLIALLEAKHPAAVVTVSNVTENIVPLVNDWDFTIPSVTVGPETALHLVDAPSHTPVHLQISAHTQPGFSRNVFGSRIGSRSVSRPARIIVCAHYDSTFNCPGAVDNGAGVAVLLALSDLLRDTPLATGLELIAFSGEEYAAIGEQSYLATNPDFENMLAAINIDGVGQKLGNNTVTVMSGSSQFERHVRDLQSDFPSVMWADPWYDSDHTLFLTHGVPSIPLNSLGVKDIYHLPKDDMRWISPEKLDEAANLVFRLITSLQDKSR